MVTKTRVYLQWPRVLRWNVHFGAARTVLARCGVTCQSRSSSTTRLQKPSFTTAELSRATHISKWLRLSFCHFDLITAIFFAHFHKRSFFLSALDLDEGQWFSLETFRSTHGRQSQTQTESKGTAKQVAEKHENLRDTSSEAIPVKRTRAIIALLLLVHSRSVFSHGVSLDFCSVIKVEKSPSDRGRRLLDKEAYL